jgi:hypothetical protein
MVGPAMAGPFAQKAVTESHSGIASPKEGQAKGKQDQDDRHRSIPGHSIAV